jgi:hypothetical protein
LADHSVGDTPEHGPLESRAAVGADHENIGSLLARDLEDPRSHRSRFKTESNLEARACYAVEQAIEPLLRSAANALNYLLVKIGR